MKTVRFERRGENISDFEAEEKVNEFIKSEMENWSVTNSLVLDYFRVKIKEKEINIDDYQFIVQDLNGDFHDFVIDKDGRSNDWKDSLDIWSNLVMRIL